MAYNDYMFNMLPVVQYLLDSFLGKSALKVQFFTYITSILCRFSSEEPVTATFISSAHNPDLSVVVGLYRDMCNVYKIIASV